MTTVGSRWMYFPVVFKKTATLVTNRLSARKNEIQMVVIVGARAYGSVGVTAIWM